MNGFKGPWGPFHLAAFRESFHVMDSALDVTGGVSQVFSSPKLTANAPEKYDIPKETSSHPQFWGVSTALLVSRKEGIMCWFPATRCCRYLSCVVMSRTAPSTKSTAVRLSTAEVDSVSLTHSWPLSPLSGMNEGGISWWFVYEITIFYVYLCLAKRCKMQILIRRHLNTTGTTGTTKDSCAHMTSSTDRKESCRFFQLIKTESNKHRSLGDKTMGSWIGSITLLPRQGVEICAPKNPPNKKMKCDHFGGESGGVQTWAPIVCFFDARDK